MKPVQMGRDHPGELACCPGGFFMHVGG